MDGDGKVVASATGGGSNAWVRHASFLGGFNRVSPPWIAQLMSVDDIAALIADLYSRAAASIGGETVGPCLAMGLCMSGFESAEKAAQLTASLSSRGLCVSSPPPPSTSSSSDAAAAADDQSSASAAAPAASGSRFVVRNDSVGSAITGSARGSVVSILGTGSNTVLVDASGRSRRCGGWGHMGGDGTARFPPLSLSPLFSFA